MIYSYLWLSSELSARVPQFFIIIKSFYFGAQKFLQGLLTSCKKSQKIMKYYNGKVILGGTTFFGNWELGIGKELGSGNYRRGKWKGITNYELREDF